MHTEIYSDSQVPLVHESSYKIHSKTCFKRKLDRNLQHPASTLSHQNHTIQIGVPQYEWWHP